MKLKFSNRIAIQSILPTKGSFDKLILAEDIKNKIKFESKKLATLKKTIDLDIREDGSMRWNPEKEADNAEEIDLSNAEVEMIKSMFAEQSNANELPITSLETYKMFKNYESK